MPLALTASAALPGLGWVPLFPVVVLVFFMSTAAPIEAAAATSSTRATINAIRPTFAERGRACNDGEGALLSCALSGISFIFTHNEKYIMRGSFSIGAITLVYEQRPVPRSD